MTGRRGRKRTQILGCLKEKKKYCKLKVVALDCITWRTRFQGGYGPIVRQQLNEVTAFVCLFVCLFFGRGHPVVFKEQ